MKFAKVMVLAGLAATISACDRYRVTLNDQSISEPPPVLTDFQVADTALQTCLDQAVKDQGIRRTTDLETLNCSHGNIKSLDGLQLFSRIRTLNLGNNTLTTIEPLFSLVNLQALNLEENPSLNCTEARKLATQLAEASAVALPEHCLAQQ